MRCPGCHESESIGPKRAQIFAWPTDWFEMRKRQPPCAICNQAIGSNICSDCGEPFLQVCRNSEIATQCDSCKRKLIHPQLAGVQSDESIPDLEGIRDSGLPDALRTILGEFVRRVPVDWLPDDMQLCDSDKKHVTPSVSSKEIREFIQTEVRAVYDLVQIVNTEVGNSTIESEQVSRGIKKTLVTLGNIVSRTEKKLDAFAEAQTPAANIRARADGLGASHDLHQKKLDAVESKLGQLKVAIEALDLSSSSRSTKTLAANTPGEQSLSGKLIPVAALSEWLAALDEDPLRNLVSSLPRLFNFCDGLFRFAEPSEDVSGQEIITELRKVRTHIIDWQERVGIHRIPVVGDRYDPELARIVERASTNDPTLHNCIKEVRKFGYVWRDWQLQKGDVVVWNATEA